MSYQLQPRLSEKTYAAAESLNVYTFEVPSQLNKNQIKQALEADYQVSVVAIRSLNQQGKPSKSLRIKSRTSPNQGRRSNLKKAYVTLKAGDSLPIFADQPSSGEAPNAR